jgi:hypothetical protein
MIRAGAPSGSAKTTVAVIPLRILNHSSTPIQLPVRVTLAPSGVQIIGKGLPSNISAVSPDSTLAGGVALWRIGGAGVLAAGDSTVGDTLQIRFASPAKEAKLTFGLNATTVDLVPAVAPDSTPAWFRDDSSWVKGTVLKGVLGVRFSDSATAVARSAAIDSVGGAIIGGSHLDGTDRGEYFLRVPGGQTVLSLDSLAKVLGRQQGVTFATFITRSRQPARFPIDSQLWRSAKLNPDSAGSLRTTWGFEMVAAPLAWGCEVGTQATQIADIEASFEVDDYSVNLQGTQPGRAAGDTDAIAHGTVVANIVAARGTVTGMIWYAGLRAYKTTDYQSGNEQTYQVSKQLTAAIEDGAPVVLLEFQSRHVDSTNEQLRIASSDSARLHAAIAFAQSRTLKPLPLIVIPAGNFNDSASTNGYVLLRKAYPTSVLVVAANSFRSADGIHRWGGSIGPWRENGGSNYGSLIDVYAPGDGLSAHGRAVGWEIVSGTSVASPFVAGTAGLLKSFDSTLTTAQVRDLILQGAQNSGRTIVEEPTRFLLNAYESLKLAAQRNPATPVCGFPVALHGLPGAQYVVFESTSVPRDSIQLPATGGYIYYSLSVAQGGRLLAVGGTADDVFENTPGQTLEYRLINGHWSLSATLANVDRRIYTERDTVDQHYEYLGDGNEVYGTVIHRESGARQDFTFGLLAEPGAVTRREEPATFAPSGDYALVRLRSDYACDNHNAKDEVYLFDVRQGGTGGFQPFLYPSGATCPAPTGLIPVGSAWAAASDRFLLALRQNVPAPSYFNTVMRSASGGGASWPFAPDVTFSGILLQGDGTITPRGDEFYWAELDLQNESGMARCYDAVRQTASPYTYVSRSPSRDGYGFATTSTDCFPEILNPAPIAAPGSADGAPRPWPDGRRHARGPVRVQGN